MLASGDVLVEHFGVDIFEKPSPSAYGQAKPTLEHEHLEGSSHTIVSVVGLAFCYGVRLSRRQTKGRACP